MNDRKYLTCNTQILFVLIKTGQVHSSELCKLRAVVYINWIDVIE